MTQGRAYPRTHRTEAGEVEIRPMAGADEAAVLAFAKALPIHDLLFLPRDISEAKVLSAWIRESERGALFTLLALDAGRIVGCGALVRDPQSWSPHVGEVRVVVSSAVRGKGVGRALAQELFAQALELGLEKIVAQMTVDQVGAIAIFEGMGFRGEALLKKHVRDRDGGLHDIVMLSHDVAQVQAQLEAYGVTEAV